MQKILLLINLIVISSICQNFLKTFLKLYRRQFDMEEIPAMFDNCCVSVRAFKDFFRKTFLRINSSITSSEAKRPTLAKIAFAWRDL